MFDRNAGLLLHITSLPGPYGIGDIGPDAFKFVDYLSAAGQSLWQILPVGPVGFGYSPYQSPSTFAGNDVLVSPDFLVQDGLITVEEADSARCGSPGTVAYEDATRNKRTLLEKAFERFDSGASQIDPADVDSFLSNHSFWLEDYSLFAAIKRAHSQRSWTAWPHTLRDRDASALAAAAEQLQHQVKVEKFAQYVFFRQWHSLHNYCRERGIKIVGDLPIYVAHDSADVWANPELFYLDESGNPTDVAGVPPDYFSETGQLWGNPIYRWDLMRDRDYDWWARRIRMILSMVDIVRLDHFRAFDAYWSVPSNEATAVNGKWVGGPGQQFFDVLREKLGSIPLIAEDLGYITEGVIRLIENNGFPGMAILEFAFDSGPDNKFLPHNYHRNLVAYSGTHDNDTVFGWLSDNSSTQDEETVRKVREYARRYVGESSDDRVPKAFIRALYASVANTVVIPVQDLLGLGGESRMNEPGTVEDNWRWRMTDGALTSTSAEELRLLAETFGR